MIDALNLRSALVTQRNRKLDLVALLAVFVAVPLLFPTLVAGQLVILGLFAVGYNFFFANSGELSLGHAAFYGLGAYGTVLASNHITDSLFIALLVGVVLAACASVIIGYLSLRQRGIYFAMITLAFQMMVFYIIFKGGDLTGGYNGIALGIENARIGPVDVLSNSLAFYIMAIAFLVGVLAGLHRIVNSPFGSVILAIRESEERALTLGYDVDRYLLVAFVISGAISGLSGGLFAVLHQYITPNLLTWFASGEVVLITILGGIGSIVGPVIGATFYVLLAESLSGLIEEWELFVGAIFLLVVMFFPSGIYGVYTKFRLGER